ncbi:MAG: PASTA domain-containing protein, partial [Acidimicrobiia bacterium]|nr:PASTA domain-containing protein [Acidimicrobiia bacterium]
VPKHTGIDLNVSAGPRPRTVPNLAGQQFAPAAAALQQLGLTVARGPDGFSDTVPPGQVIGTAPAAGASVPRGATVTLTVSKGPDMVAVPDVGGQSVPAATTTLQQAGLQVAGVDGSPDKKVTTTNPPAGTQVHRGSSVTLSTK